MLKTGSKLLDDFLGGYRNEVTCVYGEAATGKTTMCIMAAISAARQNKKVLYIDSEGGFSSQRFQQIAGSDYLKLLDKVFILKVKDFREQYYKIKSLIELSNFDFLIIDTLSFFYRKDVKVNKGKADNMLKLQFKYLASIANNGKPVIAANQVYSKLESKIASPVAGDIVVPNCDVLIRLEKNPRRIVLMKPYDAFKNFEITQDGFIAV